MSNVVPFQHPRDPNVKTIGIYGIQLKYKGRPLPLHRTPWYLRLLRYPRWRMLEGDGSWTYLPNHVYASIFGKG